MHFCIFGRNPPTAFSTFAHSTFSHGGLTPKKYSTLPFHSKKMYCTFVELAVWRLPQICPCAPDLPGFPYSIHTIFYYFPTHFVKKKKKKLVKKANVSIFSKNNAKHTRKTPGSHRNTVSLNNVCFVFRTKKVTAFTFQQKPGWKPFVEWPIALPDAAAVLALNESRSGRQFFLEAYEIPPKY